MKLRIKNFQSIGKADLDLSDFTLLVGPSNSGKTAVVRALAACLFNTPGTDYITKGESETAIQLDDGKNKILYTKGKTSKYQIDEKGYSAIGRGPFTEVEKLGYRDLNVEGASVRPQFSFQHDPPFLVSPVYSSATISTIFGSLSNSEIVRKAKHINEKDIKTLTSEVNAEQRLLEKTTKKLEAFSSFEQAEKLNRSLELSQKQHEFVTELCIKAEKTKAEVSILTQKIDVLKVIQQATGIVERIEKNRSAIDAAERLQKASEISSSLTRVQKILLDLLSAIRELFENILKKKDIVDRWVEIRRIEVDHNSEITNLDSILGSLSKIKTCPLCESKLDDRK